MNMPATILIADDEQPITEFVREVLVDEGYSVRIVHDGASALLAIESYQPDLVILDVAMPVMTGDEVLRRLRAGRFRTLPVIMATAGMHPQRFLNEGATATLAKPFDIDELLTLISQSLRPRR